MMDLFSGSAILERNVLTRLRFLFQPSGRTSFRTLIGIRGETLAAVTLLRDTPTVARRLRWSI